MTPLLLELFCGTKSIGREFENAGWEVFSLDIDPSRDATWTGDVRDFDPAALPRRPDFIWASPVCTHYSACRTNAKTPRDLEWADSLVLAALRIQEAYAQKATLHAQDRPRRRHTAVRHVRDRDVMYAIPPLLCRDIARWATQKLAVNL
jgi:hypothetical protein